MGLKKIGRAKEPPAVDYSTIAGSKDDLSPEIRERNDCHAAIKKFLKLDNLSPHEIHSLSGKGEYKVEFIKNGYAKSTRLKCIYNRWMTEVGYL